jgi:hypothetical protein
MTLMSKAKAGRLPRQQMREALDKARAARLDREARGEHNPLDEWPDGPPLGDDEAMARWEVAFGEWQETHRSDMPPSAQSHCLCALVGQVSNDLCELCGL